MFLGKYKSYLSSTFSPNISPSRYGTFLLIYHNLLYSLYTLILHMVAIINRLKNLVLIPLFVSSCHQCSTSPSFKPHVPLLLVFVFLNNSLSIYLIPILYLATGLKSYRLHLTDNILFYHIFLKPLSDIRFQPFNIILVASSGVFTCNLFILLFQNNFTLSSSSFTIYVFVYFSFCLYYLFVNSSSPSIKSYLFIFIFF